MTQESVDIVEATGPSFELVRSTLASAIELHLPGLDLSSAALDELSDATLRMRRAQDSLRAIPKTPEHSHQRSRTRRSLENAIADFTRIATMTPAEFTRLVQSDVGIDEPAVDGPAIDLSIRPLDAANGSE